MAGEEVPPVAQPDPRDKRFADPEWTSNQFYDFLKQAYLLTVHWADHLVKDAKGLDPHTHHKADFYLRQIANAVSPSNFVLTNPELLRETVSSNADNLVRSMRHAGRGHRRPATANLKNPPVRFEMFEVGRNLALPPAR
jgi:polyhydroxyalkanoate synthase